MRESNDRIRRERASPSSPRLVLRRVVVLSEGRQFREAAAALQKLGPGAVAAVAGELPLDLLADGLPHSAQLLETLFNKLIAAGQRSVLDAEQVVWQLVKLLASHDDPTLKTKVARLARALLEYHPEFQALISTRKKDLEQAVQGLGCHGLTPDVTGLTHLHAAIKTELSRHIDSYKSALHRLDELGLPSTDNKKPVDASHQRLLGLRLSEVQQRLIDNKTLLTILDKPALKQLDSLVETLATRVQSDKEALFCVSQLKRLQQVGREDVPVAAILMSFSKGCSALLDLMQIPHSPCHSDTGYHSGAEQDQDVGKDAVSRYESLYQQSRPRAMEALDALPDLKHAAQLKAKILFSVVVLAFRTCKSLRDHKLLQACRALHVDPRCSASLPLRREALRCLAAAQEALPLQEAEDQVMGLVCEALKEYGCLGGCQALRKFAGEAARVAWALGCRMPAYELDTDFQTPTRLQPEKHQRHHSSSRNSDIVRSFLWPALLLHTNYVYKAIVVTDGT
ncbi:unnamed protein product [Phaedon cochleariae]|uniref:Mitochondria-eating protein n=1 Tax=Phaedon cochleariae TaxID=80249 RepID=A0A9N9SGF6_PHACE|nr:unnamed protein product [Phaedon cochleariae]